MYVEFGWYCGPIHLFDHALALLHAIHVHLRDDERLGKDALIRCFALSKTNGFGAFLDFPRRRGGRNVSAVSHVFRPRSSPLTAEQPDL